jgi:hypothetical protein
MGLSPGLNRCTFAFVASSGNRQELAETIKNLAKLACCSTDNALSSLPSGHRSKGGLASASPPLHSKRTVQNIFELKKVIGTLYRRGSQAAYHFKASIILYVLQFIVAVFD